MPQDPQTVRDALKPLLLKDLRVNLRARGVNPAGSREALVERLFDNIISTQNYDFTCVDGSHIQLGAGEQNQPPTAPAATAATGHPQGGAPPGAAAAPVSNNFHRPDGQNTGNFLTGRSSSRVLANPGGSSQIVFGDEASPAKKPSTATIAVNAAAPPPAKVAEYDAAASGTDGQSLSGIGDVGRDNNYHRPGGQNVGNFLTNRNSSRVLAPPGGASQVSFG